MKVKSEREFAQSCLTLRDPMDCSLPGSFVHGIFQARVLEWGVIAFSAILGQKCTGYPAKICAEGKLRKKRNGQTKQPYLVSRTLTHTHKKPIRMVQGGQGRGIKEDVHKTRTSGQSGGAIE